MSIKIFDAWKTPAACFVDEFLTAFRRRCVKNAVAQVRLLMERLPAVQYEARAADIARTLKSSGHRGDVMEYATRVAKYGAVEGRLITASRAATRDPETCVDASVSAVFERDARGALWAYAIPGGEPWLWKGFNPARLTGGAAREYAFWDNQEKPAELTDREWEERRKFWTRTTNGGWTNSSFQHVVINYGKWIGDDLIRRAIIPEHYEPTGVKKGLAARRRAAAKVRK